jgi:integrase
MHKWTDPRLAKLPDGEHVIEAGLRGQGSLLLRIKGDTRAAFYRYFVDGTRKFELIGYHNQQGAVQWHDSHKGGLLKLAAIKAGFHALQALQNQHGDLKAHYAALAAEHQVRQRQAEIAARAGSFGDLLDAYVASLRNPHTRREAAGLFRRNIKKPFPALLDRKPDEITPDDVSAIMRRMLKRGVLRACNTLRAYLRAAFAWALRTVHDPRIDTERVFRVNVNPAAAVPVLSDPDESGTGDKFARMGERALSGDEVRAYAAKVAQVANPVIRAFLTVHLYSGQRVRQIIAAPWSAYDLENSIVTLIDSKGRKALAREHVVPLTKQALAALELVRPLNMPQPFAHSKRASMSGATVSHAVKKIADDMLAEGTASTRFSAMDLRRTVQTTLASQGVPADSINRLLSHDRPGKIAQTYDKHSYLEPKRAAAEAWAAFVDGTDADQTKVVPMRRSA